MSDAPSRQKGKKVKDKTKKKEKSTEKQKEKKNKKDENKTQKSSRLCCASSQENMNRKRRREDESEERYTPGSSYKEKHEKKTKKQLIEEIDKLEKDSHDQVLAIGSLNLKIQDLEINIQEYKETNQKQGHMITERNKENETLQNNNSELNQDIEIQKKKIEELNSKNEFLRNNNSELNQDIEIQKKKIEALNSKNETLQYNNLELNQEIEEHKNKIEELNSKLDELKDEVKELESERDELQEKLKKSEDNYNKLDVLNDKVKELETERDELQGKLKKQEYNSNVNLMVSKKLDELKDEVKELESERDELQGKLKKSEDNYNKKYMEKKIELKELKKEKEELDQYCLEISVQKNELENKYENLQSRFSKMASQQLTANNPQIEALGDRNRPMKVAEQFRHDLYGNEWCDAYEELLEKGEMEEKEAICTLLRICMVTFKHCQDVAKNQIFSIHSILDLCQTSLEDDNDKEMFEIDTNDQFWQLVTEKRKMLDDKRLENIHQICRRKLSKENSDWIDNIKQVDYYVKKCVNICWKMVIQDPPMMLLTDVMHGSLLNKDLWDTYQIKSDTVDFLVWPAILREENGSVLQKGIVEGVKTSKKKKVPTATLR